MSFDFITQQLSTNHKREFSLLNSQITNHKRALHKQTRNHGNKQTDTLKMSQ